MNVDNTAEVQHITPDMKKIPILIAVCLLVLGISGPAFPGMIDKVIRRGTLTVGVRDTMPPFGFLDPKTGLLVGFDCDICLAIADKLGVKVEFKPVITRTMIAALTGGNVDILAAALPHTKAGEDLIDYSISYFYDGQRILVKLESGISNYTDLAAKRVGVVKDSPAGKNVALAQPACIVVPFENYRQAFKALEEDEIEAVTTDSSILVGLKASSDYPGDYLIVGDFLTEEPYGLGLPENDSKWRDFVNHALVELWNNGEYQKIYDKWFGIDSPYSLTMGKNLDTWPLQ